MNGLTYTLTWLGDHFMLVFIGCLELLRMLRLQAERRREERMTPIERAEAEEVKLFQYLSILGIEASLGWQTDEIGKQVAEHCGNLKSEDYKRVSILLEKTVYGGLPLEPYEERTVESFLEKLREEGRNGDLRTKLRLRYACLKKIIRQSGRKSRKRVDYFKKTVIMLV